MVTNWAKGRVVVGYVRSSYEGDDACCSVALQNTAIEQCLPRPEASSWTGTSMRVTPET